MRLRGVVESGHGDAAHWLGLYNAQYEEKLGCPVFPGSLNLRLDAPFDWQAEKLQHVLVDFPSHEYGGERDIWLLPCLLRSCSDQPGYLWTTTNAIADPEANRVIEVISPVGLRKMYSLANGDVLEVEIAET